MEIVIGSAVRKTGKDQIMLVQEIEEDRNNDPYDDKDKITCVWINRRGDQKTKKFSRDKLALVE